MILWLNKFMMFLGGLDLVFRINLYKVGDRVRVLIEEMIIDMEIVIVNWE